ncbi:MAG: hypothetical protein ACXWAT_00130 [Methylobacter sp.]
MFNHSDKITEAVSTGSYAIGGALVVGDWLSILDDHAAAFGVILGALTFLTNLIFQCLNHRAIKAKHK